MQRRVTALEAELRCAVCLYVLGTHGAPCRLKCKHAFCRSCIEATVLYKSACPMCNEEVLHRSVAPDFLMSCLMQKSANICEEMRSRAIFFPIRTAESRTESVKGFVNGLAPVSAFSSAVRAPPVAQAPRMEEADRMTRAIELMVADGSAVGTAPNLKQIPTFEASSICPAAGAQCPPRWSGGG